MFRDVYSIGMKIFTHFQQKFHNFKNFMDILTVGLDEDFRDKGFYKH
jgi:hypothetical protein